MPPTDRPRVISAAEMESRKRMADLRQVIYESLQEHAVDKMTPAEICFVLSEISQRMLNLDLREEWNAAD